MPVYPEKSGKRVFFEEKTGEDRGFFMLER